VIENGKQEKQQEGKLQMSTSANRVALSGSERKPMPGARAVEPADPTERISVTVVVRSKRPRTRRGDPSVAARAPLCAA
jgi:hypothetical protein